MTILLAHAQEERNIFYGPEPLAALRALDEVRINESGVPLEGDAFIAAAKGCSIIVCDAKSVADAKVFGALPDLLALVHGHVDTRRTDVKAASDNGILVTHSIRSFGLAVAELIVGFMIDINRGITSSTLLWRSGGAPRIAMTKQLAEQTLGIIGFGEIGRNLAELAAAFRMRVIVSDPYLKIPDDAGVKQMSFEDLLRTADFVVPLAVSTPETANMIDARALSLMKPAAYVINASRGELIDEVALEEALKRGTIAGAALDVGRAEFQMPSRRLVELPNVIAAPHVGGVTAEANRGQAMETVRQVGEILAGRIPSGAKNAEHATRLLERGATGKV